MSGNKTGRCACGAIGYEFSGEPGFSFHCQCRDCQRATGGGHASAFMVALDQLELRGEIKYFERPAQSGNTIRQGFCANCGSPVLNRNSGFPDSVFIHAATLDDPASFKPQKVVYREFSQPWDFVDPEK
ncbi:MAG: GFA family protein [Rhizobiaceae bacterium]